MLRAPNCYRALLGHDGDKQGARKEFLADDDDAAKFPFAEWRNEMLVRSHNALAIIAWQEANFSEAMRWLKLADEGKFALAEAGCPISPRTVNGLRESLLRRRAVRLDMLFELIRDMRSENHL